MAILCKPAIAVPEYIITMEQTLELCQQIHAGHPQLDLALGLPKPILFRPIQPTQELEHTCSRNAL